MPRKGNLMRLRIAVSASALWLPAVAAQASEGGSSGDFYFGDVGQSIVTLFIFAVLVFVLGRWAWKPLVAQLEKREQSIAQTIEEAQKRQKDAEGLLAEYRARLDAAQAEAAELLAQARRQAAEARDTVVAAAQEESRKLTESARQEIERAKADAMTDLHEATARLAADIAGKVLRKTLTAEDHRRLMNDSLLEIRERAAARSA